MAFASPKILICSRNLIRSAGEIAQGGAMIRKENMAWRGGAERIKKKKGMSLGLEFPYNRFEFHIAEAT